MIDEQYFKEVLPAQLKMFPGGKAVVVTLTSGETYFIHEVKRTYAAYVWLQVHPSPDRKAEIAADVEKEKREGRSGFNTDELTVAYSSILSLRVTTEPKNSNKNIAFTPRKRAYPPRQRS